MPADPPEQPEENPAQRRAHDPDAFLRLLDEHERRLAIYVFGLVPRIADAEDILQETRMVMWRQFEKFEIGSNFLAWGRRIAFHQILNHRRRSKKAHLQFSEAFLESVAAEIESSDATTDRRSDALHLCLRRLPMGNRRLVVLRYFEELSIDEIAAKVGRTPGATYRALSRVRRNLHTCVSQKLGEGTA
ncbi:MAG: sigma-70 family RNA polymerase sigma factor [Verrucomicrobiales bacterium]